MDRQLLSGHYRVYLAAGTQIVAQQGKVELQFLVYLDEQSCMQCLSLAEGEMYQLQEAGWVSLSGSAYLLSAPKHWPWQWLGRIWGVVESWRIREKSGC